MSQEYDLIPALYPECKDEGQKVAKYLDTGFPITYDPSYGDERQAVLGLDGEQRALAIRQYAAQIIQKCDERYAEADAARASASAEAEASRAAAAAHRAAEQQYTEVCEQLGGIVDKKPPLGEWAEGPNQWGCAIDYPQCRPLPYKTGCKDNAPMRTFYIPLKYNSGFLADDLLDHEYCEQMREDGYGDWWHKDTKVCAIPWDA